MKHVLLSLLLALSTITVVGCHEDSSGPLQEVIPSRVFVAANINSDDMGSLGPFGRALVVVNLDLLQPYVFPFTYMAGGPAWGQPQHVVLTPDKRTAYVTVGGDATLPLRLLTIRLSWLGGLPNPQIIDSLDLLGPGTQGPANAMGLSGTQGHGLTISPDGLLIFMSELLPYPNARLRVVDARTNDFVLPSSGAFVDPGDQSLDMPHGFFANPSTTMGMSTQYRFDRNKVTVWNIDNDAASSNFGALTHAATITLDAGGGGPQGAYTHTATWLNDTEFYTCCTQEAIQGSLPNAEAAVWHVDVTNMGSPVVTQVIGEGVGGVLEGASDVMIANGSLFVAEGNVEKASPAGHISIWDISTPTAPVLVRRLSAGAGLPPDFLNAHGLAKTSDDEYVLAASYSSNHVILVSTITGNVITSWSAADGLSLPHGGYAQ